MPVLGLDTPVEDVIDLFAVHDVLALPVTDRDGRLAGAVAMDDVLEELVAERLPGRRRASAACAGRAGVRRRAGLLALAAVVGPGLLAGLSDDDPAGITTYSILGADYGYELLWLLLLSTVALVLFHEIGARMGIVTGQGLAGLIRERYGIRAGVAAVGALLVANVGTTCAEFAGVAAAMELAGRRAALSVPVPPWR